MTGSAAYPDGGGSGDERAGIGLIIRNCQRARAEAHREVDRGTLGDPRRLLGDPLITISRITGQRRRGLRHSLLEMCATTRWPNR